MVVNRYVVHARLVRSGTRCAEAFAGWAGAVPPRGGGLRGATFWLHLEQRRARHAPVPTVCRRAHRAATSRRSRAARCTLRRLPRNVVHAPPTRTTRCSSSAGCSSRAAARQARSSPRTSARPPAAGAARARRRAARPAGRCRARRAGARSSSAGLVRADRRRARMRRRRPVSRPSSTSIRQTPVSVSPARIARSTGAAPRHRGSSEKCTLTIGTTREHVRLDDLAEGDDDAERRRRRRGRRRPGRSPAGPSSMAAAFTGLGGVGRRPGPAACRAG